MLRPTAQAAKSLHICLHHFLAAISCKHHEQCKYFGGKHICWHGGVYALWQINNYRSSKRMSISNFSTPFSRQIYTRGHLCHTPEQSNFLKDPKRPGMHMKLINFLLKLKAGRFVYVSCNPASCASDLDYLCRGVPEQNISGCYKLRSLQPVVMFPHT
ncbi:Translocation associated membrane protein domain-containing protein [Forsythia ovata]|uniref:Translocation associated membrane protein domain-containing protein n=1 Tax=Forsythia ovata TaxID=205694 RepID=A0ABD1TUC6_9LAMI